MQLRYPRSFFKLLAVGFFLAVLPLIAGLIASTLTIQHLAAQSQQAVFDAARIAHASRQLSELIPTLERAARQSVVLNDPALREGYATLRQDFSTILSSLQSMPLDEEMRALLTTLVAREAEAFSLQQRKGVQSAALAGKFGALAETGRAVLAHSNAVIDREAETLHARASEAHANARMQLLIVIPVALLLVAGFTHLLTRPIAQIEAGIHALGEQKLDQPVVVEGPEDLVKLGTELDWLRQRLAALEAQKTQFLRHVSHELKTPLTALREGSDLLAEGMAGPLTARQLEIVAIVRENSIHLQHHIEDLLRHGEAEFRARRVDVEQVDVAQLIGRVAQKQAMALQAKQLKWSADIRITSLVTDGERVRVILDNLVSNAIKHAPDGTEIRVAAWQEAGALMLRVEDEGPGVPAEDRGRIFEPFYRADTGSRSKVKSTGLGLSIVHDHVKMLQGEVTVGIGHGDFVVTIPCSAPGEHT